MKVEVAVLGSPSLISLIVSVDVNQLGSHSRMDCLAAELFLSSCFSDTVFMTLLRTAVETATMRCTVPLHWRGPHLPSIIVLALADGLFGLHGSVR